MELQDFLRRLEKVSGPTAAGEYEACCPVHGDQTPSLTVGMKRSDKDGKTRIYCCCQRGKSVGGCTTADIVKALGLTMRDLIVDPDEPGKPKRKSKARAEAIVPGMEVHQAKPTAAAPIAKAEKKPPIDWGHPAAIYSYTDRNGVERFQVVRYEWEENGKRQKTFRQRVYDPGNPKANREGWVAAVPNELRDQTLYRMPQLMAAIAEGRPVYVVEGEKDVETLVRLGRVATCNPGGAGKWRSGYTELLRGADVIILPDNDTAENSYTGQNHAFDVACSLHRVARRVRLVDIREACAELPPKGDVSDMVALMGDVAGMDALARQVNATRDFDPGDVPFWLTPIEQAERLYGQVQGFAVKNGGIVQVTQDGSKALTDFVVIPRMELTKDDGVNESTYFVLDGWGSGGRKLPRVTISSKELDGMGWVTGRWGFRACLSPGTATKDKVGWAIKKVGQMTAKEVREYKHTGWRRIGGKWCYLYHGGAIGMEGVTVDMGDALKNYRLDGNGQAGFEEISYQDGATQSLRLQSVMKEEIGVALLGTAYLAPLREFLFQTDVVPAFALYLYGESGTHKTTAAALALAHFGNFHAKNAPASFNDTANSIRKKAFLLKDMPILVDDYHPTTSKQEKQMMGAVAQALSRSFGDGADRSRLNTDSDIKSATPARSVAIITGEDLPAVGISGLARYFILDLDKGDIPITADLTDLQEQARRGYLQKAMRGYILWLQKQAEDMPSRLHKLYLQFRENIRQQTSGQHDRAPETVACIMIGYAMMLNYFRDLGLFDTTTAAGMLAHAQQVLTDTSRKQAKDLESEKPTRIFLDGMAELLASGTVVLEDISASDESSAKKASPKDMVGYMDDRYYMFLPQVAFGAVAKLCREQGVEFPVSLKALYKHLRTDGILRGLSGSGDTPTKNRWINGKAVRLLWIPREVMDGPKAAQEQTRMDFTPVEPDGLPEEWK